MLIPIFRDHNKRMKELIGNEYSINTHKRYETKLKHVLDFLSSQYCMRDIPVKKVDLDFINDLNFYFSSVRNYNNNSTIKYIRNFGKIIKSCYANEWIDR